LTSAKSYFAGSQVFSAITWADSDSLRFYKEEVNAVQLLHSRITPEQRCFYTQHHTSMKDADVHTLYKFGSVIGRGSTSAVYKGVHIASGRPVAIKVMTKKDPQANRFSKNGTPLYITREIAILRILKHPHVLQLWDVLETDNKMYLILEYAGGGELYSYIMQHHRLPLDDALRFIRQIVSATQYYHELGICHRDLKPENILLDKDHNVKLADFGFAKMVLNECSTETDGMDQFHYTLPQTYLNTYDAELKQTAAHLGDTSGKSRRLPVRIDTLCGSPHYASPELLSRVLQANNAKHPIHTLQHDPRLSDVWAIGCILYAMLAGSLPFDHDDHTTLNKIICAGKFEMPSNIPEDAGDLIQKLLTVDPNQRLALHLVLQHPCFLRAPSTPTSFLHTALLPVPRTFASSCAVHPMYDEALKTRRSCGQIKATLSTSESDQSRVNALDLNLVYDLESLGLGTLRTITATLLTNTSLPPTPQMKSTRLLAASACASTTFCQKANTETGAQRKQDVSYASLCRELYKHFQEQQRHHTVFRHHVLKRRGSF
jgi:serine/threonine protein kinase